MKLLNLSVSSMFALTLLLSSGALVSAQANDDIEAAYRDLVWSPDGTSGCRIGSSQTGSVSFPSDTIKYYQDQIEPEVIDKKELYIEASTMFDFPWQLIAALHFRETSFSMSNPGNGQGIWQLYTLNKEQGLYFPPGPITEDEFIRQTGLMVDFFKSKQSTNVVSSHKSPPISNSNTDADTIKDTAWGYNGRLDLSQNDPENIYEFGYETAGYVMNMYDAYRMNLLVDSVDEGQVLVEDKRPGVFTVYSLIGGASGFICGAAEGLGISSDGFVFPINDKSENISWCGGSPPTNPNCHGSAWSGTLTYFSYDIFSSNGRGTPLVASRGGYIRNMGKKVCSSGGQVSLWIEADDGNWYWYQHTDPQTVAVSEGDRVEAGSVIGAIGPAAYVGGTCDNTDPHLHFSAASQQVGSMYRGCTQSACPDMNKLLDAGPALLEAYANIGN